MRILAVADVHGVLDVYRWLGQIVRQHRVDLLILAGDLFAYGSEEDQLSATSPAFTFNSLPQLPY